MSEREYLFLKQFIDLQYVPKEELIKLPVNIQIDLQKRGLIKLLSTSSPGIITDFAISEIEKYERTIEAHKATLKSISIAQEALDTAKQANLLALKIQTENKKLKRKSNFFSFLSLIIGIPTAIMALVSLLISFGIL